MDRVFAGLLAQGVAIWMGFQALINIGVNLGALPTKGLTLPLISSGGSSTLMTCVMLGVLLRAAYEIHRGEDARRMATRRVKAKPMLTRRPARTKARTKAKAKAKARTRRAASPRRNRATPCPTITRPAATRWKRASLNWSASSRKAT